MVLARLPAHPALAPVTAWAEDIQARGLLRGIAGFILVVVVLLVLIGIVIGVLVARRFGRRR
jgi:predicted Na+-dependent transporter